MTRSLPRDPALDRPVRVKPTLTQHHSATGFHAFVRPSEVLAALDDEQREALVDLGQNVTKLPRFIVQSVVDAICT